MGNVTTHYNAMSYVMVSSYKFHKKKTEVTVIIMVLSINFRN